MWSAGYSTEYGSPQELQPAAESQDKVGVLDTDTHNTHYHDAFIGINLSNLVTDRNFVPPSKVLPQPMIELLVPGGKSLPLAIRHTGRI